MGSRVYCQADWRSVREWDSPFRVRVGASVVLPMMVAFGMESDAACSMRKEK